MRNALKNFGLALGSLLLTFLLLEIVLALFCEVTDDLQYQASPGGGLRLRPNQQGVYVREGGSGGDYIAARFRVNNVGFNNGRDYTRERRQAPIRVAVVGDSFVEALQVEVDRSFSQIMELELQERGIDVEVYSFGVSGFGTSQVLHLVQETVLSYSPDFLIYLFIPNDLGDSSAYRGRSRWTPQYDLDSGGDLVQLPHRTYKLPAWRQLVKHSRLFRYLYYQRRLSEVIRSRGQPPPAERPSPGSGASNPQREQAWLVVEELLSRLDESLQQNRVPWLLVWQGEADLDFYRDVRTELESIARRRELPYYDLSVDFAQDYAGHARRYRFRRDGHWNRAGHAVAGVGLASVVRARLAEQSPRDLGAGD